jgi:hypothetical protein
VSRDRFALRETRTNEDEEVLRELFVAMTQGMLEARDPTAAQRGASKAHGRPGNGRLCSRS